MFCEPTLAMASCRRRVKRPVRVEGRHVHAAVRSQWWLSAHLIAIGTPAAFLLGVVRVRGGSGPLVEVAGSAHVSIAVSGWGSANGASQRARDLDRKPNGFLLWVCGAGVQGACGPDPARTARRVVSPRRADTRRVGETVRNGSGSAGT